MALRSEKKSFRNPPRPCYTRPFLTWTPEQPAHAERLDALVDGDAAGAIVRLQGADSGSLAPVAKRARKKGASIWFEESPEDWAAAAGEACAASFGAAYVGLEEVTETGAGPETLATFVLTSPDDPKAPSNDRPMHFEMIDGPEVPTGGRRFAARLRRYPERFACLEDEAVQPFLEHRLADHVHELGRQFGGGVDTILVRMRGLAAELHEVPWVADLDALFLDTRGYSLLPRLPSLFFDTAECEAVRFDYWTFIAEMFRESFASPIQRWCVENKIACCGPVPAPASLCETVVRFGPISPVYERSDVLAVPLTGTGVAAVHRDTVRIKEAVSLGAQLNKHAVYGLYAGGAKEDARSAANVFYTLGLRDVSLEASFDETGNAADAFDDGQDAAARTAWLLSQGRRACDVLVLHPASSVQALAGGAPGCAGEPPYGLSAQARWIEKHFASLSQALLENQIDFDYVDERVLAKHGRSDQKTVVVGESTYRVVVIPPSINLRATTLELLQDFATGGGRVIGAGSAPSLLMGRPTTKLEPFYENYVERITDGIDFFDYARLTNRLARLGAKTVRLHGVGGQDLRHVFCQRREWGERTIIAIANVAPERARAQLLLETAAGSVVEEWIAETGEIAAVSTVSGGGAFDHALDLGPFACRMYVIAPGKASDVSDSQEAEREDD